MRVRSVLQRYVDPANACVLTVTGLFLLALACAGYLVWQPLGIVALVFALPVHRLVQRLLSKPLVLAGIAAVASVPFAMAFLQTDLWALAATATANAQWLGPDTNSDVLHSLYCASPSWPSYSACQSFQNSVGRDLANGCYSAVGYVRAWQIPAAIPVLLSLTGLYCGIPLFVARYVRRTSE